MGNFDDYLAHGELPRQPRLGCRDIWNAQLLKSTVFSDHDIPLCPTYLPNGLPKSLILYSEAKTMYNKEFRLGNYDFYCDAFVHFYFDDYLFDGPRNSIWLYPAEAIKILKHFAGIITPDFSTYADFPDPLKRYNTFRMRGFGYGCMKEGIPVINNVRWGTYETWEYCFDGIEHNSVVCIGTVASGLKELENREDFDVGLKKMVKVLSPKTIIVYGSAKYEVFQKIKESGIEIISFESHTNSAFQKKIGGGKP